MKKFFPYVTGISAVLLCFFPCLHAENLPAEALQLEEVQSDSAVLSARDVAQLLYDADDGRTQISTQQLSSCRYALKEGKRRCSERPRVKVLEAVRKDYGEQQKDKRSVSIVLEPPVERGVGFLQYDYERQDKEADQWIYLSALGKVKRIVSGNDEEPKQGSFFGSEFSYEDMEQPHIDDYRYKILDQIDYRGRPCWVLEITPTPEHARSSNYSRSINWIDKQRHLRLKAQLFDRQGKQVKRLLAHRIEQIDGVWTPRLLNMDNLQSRRMSTMKLQRTAFNVEVGDDFLAQRTLTDGAFREQLLEQYRGGVASDQ